MVFDFKAFILKELSNTAKDVEEAGLESLLQTLHDKNVSEWNLACEGGKGLVSLLTPLATNSKFLGAILEGIGVSIDASIANNVATTTVSAATT